MNTYEETRDNLIEAYTDGDDHNPHWPADREQSPDLWVKGDRVTANHYGNGTIIGPEYVKEDANGKGYPEPVWTQRWSVELDTRPLHGTASTTGIAYFWAQNPTRLSTY